MSQQPTTPVLITPECHARGCTADGDQYMMVRCGRCGAWYCPQHIQADEGIRVLTTRSSPVQGLSYYVGICVRCYQARQNLRH
jgi:hypothetical protein